MIVYFPHFLSLRSRYFGGKNKLKEVLSLALCPMQIVGILLNDHSPGVLGAAAASFASICPNNFSLIGRNYQRLCEILPDVEEWGQLVLIGILLRFVIARHGLVKESLMFSLHCTESSNSQNDGSATKVSVNEDTGYVSGNDFGLDDHMSGNNDSEFAKMVSRCYIEGPDEYLSRLSYANRGPSELNVSQFTSGKSNNDVKILLQCTSPLLWSNNSAVVLAAAGVHWIMAPREDVKRIVKPLLFVLRSSSSSKYVVLYISLN
jgi:AP-3 complex subunit beta